MPNRNDTTVKNLADYVIEIPDTEEMLIPILASYTGGMASLNTYRYVLPGVALLFTPLVLFQAFGVKADYKFIRRIPPVINEAETTARALAAAQSALGDKRIRTTFPPSTAGDDFAFFSQDVPGCYVWLGNGPAVDGALHHNTGYDFCDDAIVPGIAFWTRLVEMDLAS